MARHVCDKWCRDGHHGTCPPPCVTCSQNIADTITEHQATPGNHRYDCLPPHGSCPGGRPCFDRPDTFWERFGVRLGTHVDVGRGPRS